MTSPPKSQSQSRISLVEVFVLILIGVVAACLLLPALPGSREKARARSCRANLRRLDLAAAQYGETKRDQLDPISWTIDLLPFCQQLVGVEQKFEITGLPARPSLLTCPSRPDTSDMPTTTHIAHYALVMDQHPNAHWSDVEFRFRDRPRDVPPRNPIWFAGVTLSTAEADRQWQTEAGPHFENGQYNESDGKGDPIMLPLPDSPHPSKTAASAQ